MWKKTEIIIVNHTMSNTRIDQTYLVGQICFNFFNDRIWTGNRVLEEKGKQVKNVLEYYSKYKSNFHAAV